MKKTLFISLILGGLTISGFIGNEPVTPSNGKQFAKKMDASKVYGPDCKLAYDRKCNFGISSVFPSPVITSPIDVYNYCRQTVISCPVTECDARLNVLYGFQAGSPKTDSCLPAGYRGK
jgi:hypothetical protein